MAKRYAFWKYDLFPFMLGTEVLRTRENGDIEPKGYNGFWFKPALVLSLKEGRALHRELKLIAAQHNAATLRVSRRFDKKLSRWNSKALKADVTRHP